MGGGRRQRQSIVQLSHLHLVVHQVQDVLVGDSLHLKAEQPIRESLHQPTHRAPTWIQLGEGEREGQEERKERKEREGEGRRERRGRGRGERGEEREGEEGRGRREREVAVSQF